MPHFYGLQNLHLADETHYTVRQDLLQYNYNVPAMYIIIKFVKVT